MCPAGFLLALADDPPDLLADRLQADPQRLQRLGGDALALADQAEQDVLGADVVVAEHPGLFLSQDRNPPRPVGEPLEHLVAPSPSGRRGQPKSCSSLRMLARAPGAVAHAKVAQVKRSPPAAGFTPPGLGQRGSVPSYAGSERARRAPHRGHISQRRAVTARGPRPALSLRSAPALHTYHRPAKDTSFGLGVPCGADRPASR